MKALKIHKHKCSSKIQNNHFSNNNSLHRYIILPNNSVIEKKLKLGIKTVSNSSKTIKDLIDDKNNNNPIDSKAEIYEIPCLDCNKKCG